MYACFDQPDLKADVHLPRDRARTTGRSRRTAARSPPSSRAPASMVAASRPRARMSPYITALVAGPYHVVRDQPRRHRPRPVVPRRRSRSTSTPTSCSRSPKQGFDWYHANFGMRYPFDKYDQLFVPGVQRRRDGERRLRDVPRGLRLPQQGHRRPLRAPRRDDPARDGAHVVRRPRDHALVGRPVAQRVVRRRTPRCCARRRATRWTERLDDVRQRREDLGLPAGPAALDPPDRHRRAGRADRRGELRRHHLRQGRERAQAARRLRRRRRVPRRAARLLRRARVRQHHAGRPALARWRQSSGRDLGEWSKLWLETTGINTLRPEFTLDADGRYTSFEIVQSAPERGRRRRTRCVRTGSRSGCYERAGRPRWCAPSGSSSTSPASARRSPSWSASQQPDLLLRQRRRPDLLQAAPGRAQPRDAALRRHRQARRLAAARAGLVGRVGHDPRRRAGHARLRRARARRRRARDRHRRDAVADPRRRCARWRSTPTRSGRRRATPRSPTPRSPRCARPRPARITSSRGRTRCSAAARTDEHIAFDPRPARRRRSVIDGLAVDDDLRWAIVQALSALGALDDDDIDAELERDPSAAGQRHAATARALQPTAEAKAEAWRLAVDDDELPNAMQEAVIARLRAPDARASCSRRTSSGTSPRSRDVWERRTSELAQNVVGRAVPDLDVDDLAGDGGRGRRVPRPATTCRRRCAGWSARAAPTSSRALRAREADAAAGRAAPGRFDTFNAYRNTGYAVDVGYADAANAYPHRR